MTHIKNTYSDTGQKSLIKILPQNLGENLFTVSAGADDVYTIEIQLHEDSERIELPTYDNLNGDTLGRLPSQCYGVGINITTNTSGSIILDTVFA